MSARLSRSLSLGLALAALSGWALHANRASAGTTSSPSAKATVKVGTIAMVSGPATSGATEGAWTTVLTNTIKTSSQKDLLVDVSLECALYTGTVVKSKAATRDSSTSTASIQVRVLIDGRPAEPGEVVFARRNQDLSAVFQGLIDGALSVDPLTGLIIIDENLLQPEEVSLVLDTMDANSFNFVLANVGTGVHRVEVQARIDLNATAMTGSAVARAAIGKGAMAVEEVRLIRNEDVTF